MIQVFDGGINPNGMYLITCDGWFFAPDGEQYRAAWGRIARVESDKLLGIKTNAKSSNWYLIVGDERRGVVIAGCQIHYAAACPNQPTLGNTTSWKMLDNGTLASAKTNNQIWIAESSEASL